MRSVTVRSVEETSRSKNNTSILIVSLWIETPNGAREHKAEVGPDGVFIESTWGDFREDRLKSLFRDVAEDWRECFNSWSAQIEDDFGAGISVPEPYEEILIEALHVDERETLADALEHDGLESFDYQELDVTTVALEDNVEELPDEADEVLDHMREIAER